MTVYLQDPDVTIHHGDALDTLRAMPAESVDCCITSPPYWGLRDYGTGAWEGGDEGCDHIRPRSRRDGAGRERPDLPNPPASWAERDSRVGGAHIECECGARRIDNQLGLEATPDAYITRMVEVFREVKRVLRAHGTCWINMGDSYTTSGGDDRSGSSDGNVERGDRPDQRRRAGLKPKDLVGIPWRLAFALQADGWWLRSDIIWSKPNPMPESVTDRPTKAHEYVFLLTKQPRYWFDQEAVREPHSREWFSESVGPPYMEPWQGRNDGGKRQGNGTPAGRNIRSVWEIATQPYPEAHFATYPEELVRRCLLAGCPEWVCGTCQRPRDRIVDSTYEPTTRTPAPNKGHLGAFGERAANMTRDGFVPNRDPLRQTLGWSDCGHNNYQPGVVLDPFIGSGTTALVARKHGRHTIGIELNETYWSTRRPPAPTTQPPRRAVCVVVG